MRLRGQQQERAKPEAMESTDRVFPSLKGQPRTAKPPIVSTSNNASATLRPSPRPSKQTTRPSIRGTRERMEGGDQETAADLARMPDSDSEQPDPAAACVGMAPYLGDIDRYMRSLELEVSRRPRGDYMWTIQKDIRPDMRTVLVDWLAEVAQDFGLPSDALHLAVSYVDRFLSATVLSQEKLQLLGVTALLVAAKYEDDIFLHEIKKYAEVTDNTYTRQQVVKMEIDILKFLNYEMGSPTARTFLQRYITACHGGDEHVLPGAKTQQHVKADNQKER